jgi:hypothetical protein
MTKKYYIYSTLTDAMNYTTYRPGGADIPLVEGNVTIQGGANIPDKFLRTPQGVVTPVTEAELELLKANQVFQLHEKNGFIKISEKKVDPEVAAADMEGRDKSAPLVDADFTETEVPVTSVNVSSDDKPRNSRKA